jgi:alpha-D-ribose 1-methylphosphonate 5-triphosphate synthase subunit PhnH
MTIRVTLEISEHLAQRLVKASCDSGRSVDRVILDAIADSDLAMPDLDAMSETDRFRWIMRHTAAPLTEEESEAMAGVFGDESDLPEMTHEELMEFMPKLPPEQWLSRAIIEDREDRF